MSTHDPTEGNWLISHCDDDIFCGQLTLDRIKRHQFFSLTGLAGYYLLPLKLVQVKGVHGLAKEDEDKVGDIDDIIYRTNARIHEAVLQPLRTWLDRYIFNHTGLVGQDLVRLDGNLNDI